MFPATLLVLGLPRGALAAAQQEWAFSYDAPAATVAAGVDAWVRKELDASRPTHGLAKAVKGRDPFVAFDEQDFFRADVVLGVLEYGVLADVRVRGVGLTETELTITFRNTDTVGEGKAWNKLGKRAGAFLDSYVAEHRQTTGELIEAARVGLADADRCKGTLRGLASSSYSEAGEVMLDALDDVSAACADSLVASVSEAPDLQVAAGEWLVSRYQQGEGEVRFDALTWIERFPAKTERMEDILAAEHAAAVDREAAETAAQAAAQEARRDEVLRLVQQQGGPWKVEAEVSPLDDSLNVYASRRARSSVTGWPGESYRPELWLRCKEGKTELYVVTGLTPSVELHGHSTERATVTIRLDKEPAEEVLTTKSSDGRGVYFSRPTQLASELAQHDELLFQFTPLNSSPQITTFDLTGFSAASEPVRLACGSW